ncbi:MAG: hypothetical protein IPI97_14655 [Nitrosomonas sp.]|nr:hypothetical protein [Nitrosomonas sp.]
MFSALLKVLGAGLSLWASKEARKYIDKKIALEKAWYEEYNKDDASRSNAVLDNLEFELRTLAIAFASEVGASQAGNKP